MLKSHFKFIKIVSKIDYWGGGGGCQKGNIDFDLWLLLTSHYHKSDNEKFRILCMPILQLARWVVSACGVEKKVQIHWPQFILIFCEWQIWVKGTTTHRRRHIHQTVIFSLLILCDFCCHLWRKFHVSTAHWNHNKFAIRFPNHSTMNVVRQRLMHTYINV